MTLSSTNPTRFSKLCIEFDVHVLIQTSSNSGACRHCTNRPSGKAVSENLCSPCLPGPEACKTTLHFPAQDTLPRAHYNRLGGCHEEECSSIQPLVVQLLYSRGLHRQGMPTITTCGSCDERKASAPTMVGRCYVEMEGGFVLDACASSQERTFHREQPQGVAKEAALQGL